MEVREREDVPRREGGYSCWDQVEMFKVAGSTWLNVQIVLASLEVVPGQRQETARRAPSLASNILGRS